MPCVRYLVAGRVQGVFYRVSTRDKARSLSLTGWAKNLADGRVEVLACGEVSQLKALEAWLWQGPDYASVSEVVTEALDESETESELEHGQLHGFRIRS